MKYVQFVLCGTLIFAASSCGVQGQFNKRKYTKGIFHANAGHWKSDKNKKNANEEAIYTFQEKEAEELLSARTADVSDGKAIIWTDEAAVPSSQNAQKIQSVEVEETDVRSENGIESIDISVADTGRNKERAKDSMTVNERRARQTLVLGIVTLGILLLVTGLIIFGSATGSIIIYPLYRLYSTPLLLGLLGIFQGTFFYGRGEPLSDKFANYRRKGVFMSFLAILIVLLFL